MKLENYEVHLPNYSIGDKIYDKIGPVCESYGKKVLIIGGTSLTVYPAAGLIDYYQGNRLVLINKSVTPMDSRADLVISGKIGEVLGQV